LRVASRWFRRRRCFVSTIGRQKYQITHAIVPPILSPRSARAGRG
jgi:hypothetical protein